jgi:acyl-CoA synthetase (AMP-forming)/AMP-acid ligase II
MGADATAPATVGAVISSRRASGAGGGRLSRAGHYRLRDTAATTTRGTDVQDRTHRWEPPEFAAPLVGPGGPFELIEEDVLGVPTTVFRNRPPHLRAVLETAVTRMPDAAHFVFDRRDGGELRLSYADSLASVARIGAVLADAGVAPGDRVAIAAANVPAHPLTWWATVTMGAIVTSFNGWWTSAEMAHGLALSEPKVVVADERRLESLREAGLPEDVVVLRTDDLEELLGPPRPDDPPLSSVEMVEDDPVVILFTSGTTGRPKGATLSHRNFVHSPMVATLQGAIGYLADPPPPDAPPRPQPSSLVVSPIFHISGVIALAIAPVVGSRLVFPPVGAWDEVTHLRLTEEHRVASWSGVPTQFWRLLEHPRFDEFDVTSVTNIGGGGATFAPELFKLMERKLPGARVGCGYGMSETMGSGSRLGGVTLQSHPASVGTVEPLCEIQIRDASDQPLPEGEVGQICIKGPAVFLGYWGNPDATADALDARRWYRTGDFGSVVDGVLYLESRMRDLIIRGGENVYPIEIENRLVEHPAVAQACVVGVPHHQLGQEVCAVVVRRDGSDLGVEEVREWVGATLARYKVPAHVVFRPELPYNATGKVLKHQVETDVAEALGDGGAG